MALPEALSLLRAHLEGLREEGVRDVDLSPASLELLKRLAARGRAEDGPATAPKASSPKPSSKPSLAQDMPTASKGGRQPSLRYASSQHPGLLAIAGEIAQCRACRLCESRTNVVPGQGRLAPDIMFIGEGPGEEEDLQGLAFVGRAGQLLTQIIDAMGYTREEVFIGNIVKCRPPGNRTPLPDEMAACIPFLERQIEIIRPKLIVALGGTALKGLFNDPKLSITRLRGVWMEYRGIPVMPTFHPAYLLRNPPAKRDVWADMKRVLERLGRPVPERGRRANSA